MVLTLDQYLKNPQGKGSVTANVMQWKKEYDPRYERLLDKHKEFEVVVYKASGGDRYYIHVRVPSETYDNVVYDVVLKVEKKGLVSDGSIIDWPLKAISNSPSFVYTYENVFKRNKLLVEELRHLLPDETYREKPVIRNPHSIVGFEKSIYYAARYVMKKFKYLKSLDNVAIRFNISQLKSAFVDFDKIMAQINKAKAKRVEENKKERARLKQKKQRNVYRTAANTNLPPTEQKISHNAKIVERNSNRIKPKASTTNRIKPKKKI